MLLGPADLSTDLTVVNAGLPLWSPGQHSGTTSLETGKNRRAEMDGSIYIEGSGVG